MEFRAMHKFAVFLIAVIACSHLVFSVEGRQLKTVSRNDSKQSSKTDNPAVRKEDHQPGAIGYIPNAANHSVSRKKEVLPPAIPTGSSDFGDSITGYKDDFRPTTPGNSPGVGHSFEEDDEDIVQKPGSISSSNDKHSIAYIPNAANHSASGKKEILPPAIPTRSSDFGDSITGYKDDFRPTTPGNSPGVGHSFEEDDEDIVQKPGSINSSNDKHSIAGENESLRTTSPGHSPGVGHDIPSEKSEPNA